MRKVEVLTCRWTCDKETCAYNYKECGNTSWRSADVLESPVPGDDTYWVDVWSDALGRSVARFIPAECVRELSK